MRHGDLSGDRFEQVVVVAVATTGLVADLEAVGQGLEDPHHLVDGANLGAADDLPGLAEDTDRDALVVDIETDVEHGCLLKSIDIGTAATVFQVTRLTEASLHSLNTDAPSAVASGPMSAGSALVVPHLLSLLNGCHPRPVNAYSASRIGS